MTSEAIIAALAGTMVTVVGVLWRLHLQADAEDRRQRDRFADLLDLSLENNRESIQNNRDAIAAWAKRDESDAARTRRGDGR